VRLGIECGGTFTDLVLMDEAGALKATAKVFSTPDDPSRAVRAAIEQLSDDLTGVPLLHGSTVATNAVLERKGPRLGLLVTAGFRDLLLLARHDRDHTFDLRYTKPTPLVDRSMVREVPERLDPRGTVLRPLDEDAVRAAVRELVAAGAEAFAVSLLHSYADGAHERRVREIVAELAPDAPVSLSSDVIAEFREYERTSTTVVDAFVRPTVSGYLGRLEDDGERRGLAGVSIMQSHGGMVPARFAAARPVQALLSGPAAGVAGAAAIARAAGVSDLVTLDMGGTSTDVCLITGGTPRQTYETKIDRMPIRMSMIDIATVGAGGGSIVSVDSGGMLRVGPSSVGADPGPACYARGGSTPTVTDADVTRGLIRPGHSLAGQLTIDRAAARESVRGVAETLGSTPERLSEDVYKIASVAMAGAIRLVSVERGVDVRGHTLLAFGGAGPLHAAQVADETNMSRVLVPPNAGLLSAYGLLAADFRRQAAVTDIADLAGVAYGDLAARVGDLTEQLRGEARDLGEDAEALTMDVAIDMRYRGQGFELTVPVPPEVFANRDVALLEKAFHDAHQARYGHADLARPVQTVTYRVTATAPRGLREVPVIATSGEVRESTDVIVLDGAEQACRFLWRASLPVGYEADGPAVVEEPTTTTFVPPGWSLRVDEHTSLVLTRR